MSLRVEGVSKRFGAVQAIAGVSLDFLPGRIHAVLGENGAGKSTLMGALAGFVVPDAGDVVFDNHSTAFPFGKPFACKRLGIEMIHQHFTLVPDFTVAENLALARLDRIVRAIDPIQMASKALALAEDLGWQVDPQAKVGYLPVGQQQRIEILKALGNDARVVIFDEPTAVLSSGEVHDLFRVIRQLRDRGKIVILIAHKLSEVTAVADYVTVLRRGVVVGEGEIADFTEAQLAQLMVGELPPCQTKLNVLSETVGLEVDGLSIYGDRGELAVRSVRFQVRRGEILGIGGVDGNGQVELAEGLAAIRPCIGDVRWEGSPLHPESLRIGYIPQDRHVDGLAMGMSILDNMLVTGHRKPELGNGPFLEPRNCLRWAKELMSEFNVKAQSPEVGVVTLSGGNQQKVIAARTLESPLDLLVAVNPTRGLDVKATAFVHDQLRQARSNGTAVVLFSTDLDELAEVADRVLFMSRGELRVAEGAQSLVG